MMKYLNALYELQVAFRDDEDYSNAHSLDIAIDLWDSFNKPQNPAVAVPRLQKVLGQYAQEKEDGAFGYTLALMALQDQYPEYC